MLALALLCAACSDDDDDGISTSDNSLRRVVIVYIIGENSLSSIASSDLQEMRDGMSSIPEDCELVVYYDTSDRTRDRTEMPTIVSMDSVNGEQEVYSFAEDVDSADGEQMESTLRYILDRYPAKEYGLIMWSHGSGWIPRSGSTKKKTIGVDNNKNNTSNIGSEMEISTMKQVLEDLGVTWKYIFYDVCFMQCVEVAYELRQLTEWSLGSPAEIPDTGAPYDILMPYFFEATNYAKDIVEKYYQSYMNSKGLIISAVKSSELETFANATANVVSNVSEFTTTDIQHYCEYKSNTLYKPEYYDMGSCIYHWTDESTYSTWEQALDAAVPYRYCTSSWLTVYSGVTATMTDAEHFAGVSMYFPISGRTALNTAWRDYDWYSAAGYLLDK